MSQDNFNHEEQPLLSLLQDIKNGMDPKLLSKESRQRCVELLHFGEGQLITQVADLLKCSDKTIQRDIKEIRDRNVLTIDAEFARQIASDLYHRTINHVNYLMRLARNKESTITEKITAELGACKAYVDMIDRFQSFGCLPERPRQISGDVYHHFLAAESEKSVEELKQMVERIEASAKEAGTFDTQTEGRIKELRARIARIEINRDASKLLTDLNKATEQKEELNGQKHTE